MRYEEECTSDYGQILATRIDLKMLVHTIESHSKVFISKNMILNYIEERKSVKSLKKNYSNIDENKCLIIESDRYLYFNQSILRTNLILTNKCQYKIAQFEFMCTRNNELSASPHVLRVDEQEFQKRSCRIKSSKADCNLQPILSQFQIYIQWKYLTPNPMITYYRKSYFVIIAKRSSSHQRGISTSIWNSIPYSISIFIALMFGYIFGRFYH